mmetsp:Transcript_24429/g.62012  ORF Transcript_24429/g.62012 Transcript_24429/m.62012 type:complete len:201 (-) Transcript_24429:312-914(-)
MVAHGPDNGSARQWLGGLHSILGPCHLQLLRRETGTVALLLPPQHGEVEVHWKRALVVVAVVAPQLDVWHGLGKLGIARQVLLPHLPLNLIHALGSGEQLLYANQLRRGHAARIKVPALQETHEAIFLGLPVEGPPARNALQFVRCQALHLRRLVRLACVPSAVAKGAAPVSSNEAVVAGLGAVVPRPGADIVDLPKDAQ